MSKLSLVLFSPSPPPPAATSQVLCLVGLVFCLFVLVPYTGGAEGSSWVWVGPGKGNLERVAARRLCLASRGPLSSSPNSVGTAGRPGTRAREGMFQREVGGWRGLKTTPARAIRTVTGLGCFSPNRFLEGWGSAQGCVSCLTPTESPDAVLLQPSRSRFISGSDGQPSSLGH